MVAGLVVLAGCITPVGNHMAPISRRAGQLRCRALATTSSISCAMETANPSPLERRRSAERDRHFHGKSELAIWAARANYLFDGNWMHLLVH
jgi:hypothetical protein